MTPEEIVSHLHRINREVVQARPTDKEIASDQLLALMDAAAMRGFQFGSNVAMSMVQGTLLVHLLRVDGKHHKRVE